MASIVSQERYKRAVERNINGLNVVKHKGKSLESLKHILGVRASDNSYDTQLKDWMNKG